MGWVGGLVFSLWALSCAAPEATKAPDSEEALPIPSGVITLGDIDPDAPAERISRIQPLADHLAARLETEGIGSGRVVIARNIEEMARFLSEGRVDVYLDSAFPALSVRQRGASRIVLQRAVRGDLEYWAVLVSRAGGAVTGLEDLEGRVIAFQEPYSTSGYLLPAGALAQEGVRLVPVQSPVESVPPGSTGFLFSNDEENTLTLVLDGTVAAGAVSNQSLDELPPELRERLTILFRTIALPRQVVSVRSTMGEELEAAIRDALLELDGVRLEDDPRGWSWSFAPLTPEVETALTRVEELMELLPEVR